MTIGVWMVLVVLAAVSIAPHIGRLGWAIDLVGGLSSNLLALTAVFGVLVCVRRRWIEIAVLLIIVGSHIVVQLPPRADRASQPIADGSVVRVMQYNAYTANESPEDALSLLLEQDVDLIALTEPPDALLDLIRASDRVVARWPFFNLPDRASGGYRLILSRWPMDRIDHGIRIPDRPKAVRIDHPSGSFIFVLLHPSSPRTADAWQQGNRAIEALAQWSIESLDVPMVIAADLNGTPTSWRARMLRAAGLRQAMPRLTLATTFPSWSRFPLAVQIDDVWVSEELEIASWRVEDASGSDHRSVVAEVVLPEAAGSGAEEDSSTSD